MKISFLGACQEIGRSCLLVECGQKKIMLDCGIKLGRPDEYPEIEKELIKKIDAVILTHAHLDHCGFLPHLYALGYHGPIYCTKPTRDLAQLLLSDYHRICKLQGKKAFSAQDLINCLKDFKFLEYWKKTKIFPEIYITLYRTGHILGSAGVRLQHKNKALYYTGDLSVRETNLLYKADTQIEDFDYLIIESTYGSKKDILPSLKKSSRKLAEMIKALHGKMLIPSFGVGRAQDLMIIIDNYIKSGFIPLIPAYLDGMIKKANKIYRQNVLWLKEEIPKRILLAEEDPFKTETFRVPKTRDRSDVLENEKALILTTSGMLTGGPSLFYLARLAPDPKNIILLVGYQAENTIGRKLLEGEKEIILPNKKEIKIKARIESINFSAHADFQGLLNFVSKISKPKKIFIVHGEKEKCFEFAEELRKNKNHVIIPRIKESFVL